MRCSINDFIRKLLPILILAVTISCSPKKRIDKYKEEYKIGDWKREYDQSLYNTIQKMPKGRKNVTYIYDSKNELKYIRIKLKFRRSYVEIEPDYRHKSPIIKPPYSHKINDYVLKTYKVKRVSFQMFERFMESYIVD